MANEKILILEAPWSDDIENTQATRDIYTSAETLLRLGSQPIRIIQRTLVSTTYLDDIEKFADLECNRKGINVIIFSAHGSYTLTKKNKHRRKLEAFDGTINISQDIRRLSEKLGRTIIVLDSCDVGEKIESFRLASGSLATIGFAGGAAWVDSSVFILALLLRFQEEKVFHLQSARRSTEKAEPTPKRVIREMLEGTYRSFKKTLSIEFSYS